MTYIVQKGDSLWKIARTYGTTVDAIAKLNNIGNPGIIRVGQVLMIPGSVSADPSPDYSAIGRAVVECLDAIEKLPEYKKLQELI